MKVYVFGPGVFTTGFLKELGLQLDNAGFGNLSGEVT